MAYTYLVIAQLTMLVAELRHCLPSKNSGFAG